MTMTHYADGQPALMVKPHPTQAWMPERKWKIYRNRRGAPRWFQRWLEAWWIITGQWSLHRAWQEGLDDGTRFEHQRLITNKAAIAELKFYDRRASHQDREG